jgi:hypothetical protein
MLLDTYFRYSWPELWHEVVFHSTHTGILYATSDTFHLPYHELQ